MSNLYRCHGNVLLYNNKLVEELNKVTHMDGAINGIAPPNIFFLNNIII